MDFDHQEQTNYISFSRLYYNPIETAIC